MRFAGLLAAMALVLVAAVARADSPPHGVALYVKHAPVLDATNEKAWADAPPLLFPAVPSNSEGKPLCQVRFLWTSDGVYLAFHTLEMTPAFGHSKVGDPLYQEDSFEFFVDQMGDHRQYYEIQADPAGQIYIRNYILTAPPQLTPEKRLTQEFCDSELWRYDLTPPPDLRIVSKLDPQTHVWNLEMFLPKLFVNRRRGAQAMAPCTWRINLVRHDWDLPKDAPGRTVQFMYWAPVLKGCPHISPEAMGYLELKK